MVDLLKTSMMVTVTVIPSLPDGSPRRLVCFLGFKVFIKELYRELEHLIVKMFVSWQHNELHLLVSVSGPSWGHHSLINSYCFVDGQQMLRYDTQQDAVCKERLQSQYIFYLLIFMVNNVGSYHPTSQIHGFNTRCNFDLYCPQTDLTIYQRGPYYFGIKLFNHLPSSIKDLACNAKRFRVALSAFLHTNSFYTFDEYFNQG
jgi:hypothetical protein